MENFLGCSFFTLQSLSAKVRMKRIKNLLSCFICQKPVIDLIPFFLSAFHLLSTHTLMHTHIGLKSIKSFLFDMDLMYFFRSCSYFFTFKIKQMRTDFKSQKYNISCCRVWVVLLMLLHDDWIAIRKRRVNLSSVHRVRNFRRNLIKPELHEWRLTTK